MAVRYVYVPESIFDRILARLPWIAGALLIGLAIAAAVYLWWPNEEPGLASFLADDTATVYVVDNSFSLRITDRLAFLAGQVESIGLESKENSQVALILFGTKSDQVLALNPVQAEEWADASRQVNGSMGITNLFSAARHGLALLESVAPGVDRKLVILTDGRPQDVNLLPEVIETATEFEVSVDTIVLDDTSYSVVLETLSDSTGGTFQVWDDLSVIAN